MTRSDNTKIFNNVIITGIPRSGTTLVASMIDNLDGGICLSEPEQHVKWLDQSQTKRDYVEKIFNDFTYLRERIRKRKRILNRYRKDGSLATNYFNKFGKKKYVIKPISYENIFIDSIEERDIILGFKHNAHYSSVLSLLVSNPITIILVVRHPVPTLLSWRRLSLPISKGKLPAAEKYWPEIRKITLLRNSLLIKQAMIYNEFCKLYSQYENYDNVLLIKYEDIIQDNNILSKVFQRRQKRLISIENLNKNPYYPFEDVKIIKKAIKEFAPESIKYYKNINKF